MTYSAPGALKTLNHLFTGDVFVRIHSGEIGKILLGPLAIWPPQTQTPRLLLNCPFAPPEVLFEPPEREPFVRKHAGQIGDFLFGPSLLGHGLPPTLDVG